MGKVQTHYFPVHTLSMGGMLLRNHEGVTLSVPEGSNVELLIYNQHLSLRCVARVVKGIHKEIEVDKEHDLEKCVELALEIVGIDEKSRKLLAEFLHRLGNSGKRLTQGGA